MKYIRKTTRACLALLLALSCLFAGAAPVSDLKEEIQRPVSAAAQDDAEKTVGYYASLIGIEPVAGWLVCIRGEYYGDQFRLKSGRCRARLHLVCQSFQGRPRKASRRRKERRAHAGGRKQARDFPARAQALHGRSHDAQAAGRYPAGCQNHRLFLREQFRIFCDGVSSRPNAPPAGRPERPPSARPCAVHHSERRQRA